jgi:hypothetical protein
MIVNLPSLVRRRSANQIFRHANEPVRQFPRWELTRNQNGDCQMSGSNIARAGLLLLASLCLPGAATHAAVSSPFAAMAGAWSGGGALSTSDGNQERLRCRANYDVAGSGDELRLNLRCASESYNFDLAGNVEYRGGAISGAWTEASRNASGTISGRAAGDRIEAAARGDAFSANLSLTTRGHRQIVSIRPQGTNITAVSLELDRR